jgi:hypothetical protein
LKSRSEIEAYLSPKERAWALVVDAIRAGKLWPADADAAATRAEANPLAFQAEMAAAPQVIPLGEVGSDEDAPAEAIELGPIPEDEVAAALSRSAQSLYDMAGQLTAADYPMDDKPWLTANLQRGRLRAVADWAWDRASTMRRRVAQGLDPTGAERPRGRPAGSSDVELREFAASTRAVALEVEAVAAGRAVLLQKLNTPERRHVVDRAKQRAAIRREDDAAWLGIPLGTYKTYLSKLRKAGRER